MPVHQFEVTRRDQKLQTCFFFGLTEDKTCLASAHVSVGQGLIIAWFKKTLLIYE